MQEFLDWVAFWTVAWGITAVQWLQHTTEWAGTMFLKARELYNTLWGRLSDLASVTVYNRILAANALAAKIGEVWGYGYFWVEEVFHELIFKLRQVTVLWWTRLVFLFNTMWAAVDEWWTDWVAYATWLFKNHKLKINLLFVDDWLRVVWLVVDRFEDLHGIIESHLNGWRTFIDDPAQALWDWVKPKLQNLVATYLVELW
jgi:hypothetical protein